MSYTREQIEGAVKAKGYAWFDDASNKGFDVKNSNNLLNRKKLSNNAQNWKFLLCYLTFKRYI